ncbi:MAG: glycoside hydrolase family 127 protein [Acidobacteriota bacterium]|nr:glycoside hydrolase family 127 protein [Acidobacteriota bacterium]
MRYLVGLVCAAALFGQAPTKVVPNRAPLAPNAFYQLPLGAVKPAGWLKQQLRIQANGLSGHLDEIWPDVGPDSAWLGGKGEGWERGPYYLDGLLPLAYLLEDPALIAKAQKWVNWTLDHQRADGGFGPEATYGKPTADWWPNMVMLKVLTQYQEVSGDARVIPLLEKYFAYQAAQLETNPLHEWAEYRWGDEVLSIIWLYNRNGDEKLLDLARQLARQGFDWKGLFADYPYKSKVGKKDATLKTHGVNNAMALKTEALFSLISGDQEDRESSRKMLAELDRYHGAPSGTFAADEHVAGRDPSQGTELCAVVEEMFSLEELTAIYGDAHLANRLERIAFNALPGTFGKDMWSHQYDQQPNQVLVSDAQRDWTTNGSKSNLFGFQPNFGCCTANMHQGWPKFAASMWMGTADNGLAAISYAPVDIKTTVGTTAVHIGVQTDFPFEELVTIKIDPAEPATFPIKLRIPGWTASPIIRVNGATQREVKPGTFFTISREWRPGDVVLMKMQMPVVVSHGYRKSVFVSRGPLLYSLAIGEKWKKLGGTGQAADWEVDPTTPWNYALIVNKEDPQSSFGVTIGKMTEQPFSPEGSPVGLHAKAMQLRSWKLVDNSAGPLPESPVKGTGSVEDVTLIPYGAAKLRITEFPEIQK